MIDTKNELKLTSDPLTLETVRDLAGTAGPCITVILPPYRPGEPAQPAAALLKTDLQEAAEKLVARKVAPAIVEELLEPLRQLSHEEEALAGSGFARAIFRAPGVFRQFDLRVPPSPAQACIVGDSFAIRPLLQSLGVPEKIYVLEVNKKAVALLACMASDIARVDLPHGTPNALEDVLGFDAPDHDLVNRSSAGPSVGAMHGVQFGTGYGREAAHAHLHDFFRAVDRGVNQLLHGSASPLILAGVDEDVNLYRAANTYPDLLEHGIAGSAGETQGQSMSRTRILHQAQDIALFSRQRTAALRMEAAKERFTPGRFSVDLPAILQATAEARVQDLYLDENGRRVGTFEGKIFGGHGNWHDEDLLNVAAVETLRGGGAVFSLPSHAMPSGAVAAATFRY